MIDIQEGIQKVPIKAVIYGAEGIGKSTLASKMPGAIFFDIEGGTAQLNVRRTRPLTKGFETLDEILSDMGEIIAKKDQLNVQTMVFDTMDALELLITKNVCKKYGKDGIESFGYSKGYTYVAEDVKRFLDKCDAAIFAGINITILAHAKITKFEQPDEMGAYDRWELKLSKRSAPLLKEWADLLLFCNYKTTVVTSGEGLEKKKKVTGGKRVAYASHNACWDAKNRFGLPDEFVLDFANIAKLYEGERASIDFGAPAADLFNGAPVPDDALPFAIGEPVPAETVDYHEALRALMGKDRISEDQILKALGGKYGSLGEIPGNEINDKLLAKWDRFVFFINNGGK